MVLISNPHDDPSKWQIQYIEGPETYGYIAGSAAVLKDEQYLLCIQRCQTSSHEVYALRWKIDDAYSGNIKNPEWCINREWINRKTKYPFPATLFIGVWIIQSSF
ncbi:MAG: hypothetical protein IPN33_26155 [Saprospiraceae bacterium]|nr:hypothetical protein [Saprospiraceae bacterium]